ncbi:YggN family protein [Vibrio mediterranei]|uniref:YggN family protein n=1 Tax=Vibrio mediterranei TaxID=689 RepID=UPI001EFC34C2|nr:YggN family protein [Vibrio mediterranei]MCG9628694.1 YggN family protein [Vibrio mediterranei]
MKIHNRVFSRSLLLSTLLASGHALAVDQCGVDIKNEVHLDGEQVEIVKTPASKVLIDQDNNLFINGKAIELTQLQKEALESYRENMNKYVPKAKDLAENGLELTNELIDDVAESFDNSEAFQNVKQAVAEFFADVESRYENNGEFVLQSEAFSSFMDNWEQDVAKAKEVFNKEFFSSAFTALQEKMSEEGGLNLTELSKQMDELKTRMSETMKVQSESLKQQAEDYCDSLNDVAEQEQDLQKKIPELKDYQVFTI